MLFEKANWRDGQKGTSIIHTLYGLWAKYELILNQILLNNFSKQQVLN